MQYAGFSARIMKARRLMGDGPHSLPPGNPVDVYPVDAFKEPLPSWIAGPGNYVVPVDTDWGLWFDFTDNDWTNTAVLLSIKGMNPITGQRTNGFMLERYKERCPIHDEPFKDGLFCEKCNFKWPDQNYVAYPNKLWWDGFRTADGKVRQFFFTEDLAKSVPELVIGKEDTVPAFGFAFYRPKVVREAIIQKHISVTQQSPIFSSDVLYGSTGVQGSTESVGQTWAPEFIQYKSYNFNSKSISPDCFASSIPTKSLKKSSGTLRALRLRSISDVVDSQITDGILCEAPRSTAYFSNAVPCAASADSIQTDVQYRAGGSGICTPKPRTTEVGVGAGAEILQGLTVDPLSVSDWKDKPESVMRLFFVFVDQFNAIKEKGMKDLIGEKEGFLSGLPVG
jgi:hypothetical protein